MRRISLLSKFSTPRLTPISGVYITLISISSNVNCYDCVCCVDDSSRVWVWLVFLPLSISRSLKSLSVTVNFTGISGINVLFSASANISYFEHSSNPIFQVDFSIPVSPKSIMLRQRSFHGQECSAQIFSSRRNSTATRKVKSHIRRPHDEIGIAKSQSLLWVVLGANNLTLSRSFTQLFPIVAQSRAVSGASYDRCRAKHSQSGDKVLLKERQRPGFPCKHYARLTSNSR